MTNFKQNIYRTTLYKLFVAISAAALFVIFLIIGIYEAHNLEQNRINELKTLTSLTAKTISEQVAAHLKLVAALQSNLQTFNKSSRNLRDSATRVIIEQTIDKFPEVAAIFAEWATDNRAQSIGATRSGTLIKPIDDSYQLNNEFTERALRAMKLNSSAVISEPFTLSGEDNLSANRAIAIFAPLSEKGVIIGYLRIDVLVQHYENAFSGIIRDQKVSFFLLTASGNVLSHTNQKYLTTEQLEEHYKIESGIFKTVSEQENIHQIKAKQSILVLAPITFSHKSNYWILGIDASKKQLQYVFQPQFIHTILLFLFGVVVYLLFSIVLIQKIIIPLHRIRFVLSEISLGNISQQYSLPSEIGGEIGEISKYISILSENIARFTTFAKEIGSGNIDYQYDLLSENDHLGKSLMEMQKSLQKARNDEQERRKEEELKNWITHGIAQVNDILRLQGLPMKQHMLEVLKYIVDYIEANQGVLFIGREIENPEDPDENMEFYALSAMAWGRKRAISKAYKIGESLVGRCAFERQTLLITDIPKNYVNISSGLGKANPSTLLLVPLVLNQQIFGVIEIASFNPIEKHHINFVEKISESIASVIANQQVNEKTNRLLQQTKVQAEELAQKEEEMRQNLEEMQATQEEFSKRAAEMEALKYAVDQIGYVFYLNHKGEFVRANWNYADLLGITELQMIGKNMSHFKEIGEPTDMSSRDLWDLLLRGNSVRIFREYKLPNKKLYLREVYSPVNSQDMEIHLIICVAQKVENESEY
ncbi:MAG TPA: GAF domain-containing protein [Salinivirgaceae bacterium]|nr:GAF domain-containing protein [Salinivirgaceae bacterium]